MNQMDLQIGRRDGDVLTPLLETPFHPRLEALDLNNDWSVWSGFKAPATLSDEELEYFAIRSTAALFDISPMTKYRIEGPDAEAFCNRLTLRDVRRLGVGRVQYTAWCDDQGHVLGIAMADARTLFGLKGELEKAARERPGGASHFRVEVNQQYTTRYLELLMLHVADHGALPLLNRQAPPPRLGRLSPL